MGGWRLRGAAEACGERTSALANEGRAIGGAKLVV